MWNIWLQHTYLPNLLFEVSLYSIDNLPLRTGQTDAACRIIKMWCYCFISFGPISRDITRNFLNVKGDDITGAKIAFKQQHTNSIICTWWHGVHKPELIDLRQNFLGFLFEREPWRGCELLWRSRPLQITTLGCNLSHQSFDSHREFRKFFERDHSPCCCITPLTWIDTTILRCIVTSR